MFPVSVLSHLGIINPQICYHDVSTVSWPWYDPKRMAEGQISYRSTRRKRNTNKQMIDQYHSYPYPTSSWNMLSSIQLWVTSVCTTSSVMRNVLSSETKLFTTLTKKHGTRNREPNLQHLLTISKVFFKVSYHHIFTKPNHYGVTGTHLGWIRDFLGVRIH